MIKELMDIQRRIKATKDLTNAFGGYQYRSAESILEAVKPLLVENNCVLTLSDDVRHIGDRYYIQATATITNSQGETATVQAHAREPEEKKGYDASQLTGAASSYARKYALCGLLAIDDNKDADALPSKEEIDDAIEKVNQAKSVDEVTAIWNDSNLKFNESFKKAVAKRGKELKGK